MIHIKSKREIELMRKSCQLAAKTLKYIEPYVRPGISTEELNNLCHEFIIKHGAMPSPLNYRGFPKSICTSLNSVICHGIPSPSDILEEGDIINIDVTTYLNKFHGDTNKTFLVGAVSPIAKKLVEVTFECLMAGISEVKPNAHLGNIGARIAELAHAHGYSVVEDYCGHGIGREFHEEPQVVHNNVRGTGVIMRPGMTFTIEPMINLGKKQGTVQKDGWTVMTKDKKLSAQFEHTILVTESGHEILTLLSD
ncbi:MAG: type I methionyl aminopeptidase [Bdellovibrionales bacterium RIFOXYD12_FULL_39_22]|nr:MAG: type I methionyl aminopeptidase [Bdellovibrionales bacterium RIFOXYB1_FULL_39_21]OFZ41182.1 MAG: type I methionyl aminopeptidase [Bdellovibrionales bacterium RIFOXYC12_FULL_39_17]OFZ44936.1 MAG: type I methionyl aminopeptidase [Bdellovibrionales bacterium RIFOXYC1_FULL_39_130]OFZ74383.1 MAG: type I methionyl aminopeptidase [Bdellovibrionales bacterium RIFOXYD1_FULL_39_84]OFZ92385.1 MAG: type I methionyl aminopeptidase [Bdellovibrionales bacterium RIFOXYD12_FULL_39_22]HLE10712.1 type I 